MQAIPCPIDPFRLMDLYTVQKLTDQNIVDLLIGEGHDASLKRVRSWRVRFGIDTVHRWSRHDVPPIEGRLQSLLVGSMLGDGRLVFRTHATHYEESHSLAQKPYLEWKEAIWGPAWVRVLRDDIPDKRGFTQCRMWTVAHGSLNAWRDLFYHGRDKGWKRFIPQVVDLVDEFALAVWYLDDGGAEWWPEITFGADEASRRVALAIFEKFNLNPRWEVKNGKTGVFHFEREDTAERFIELIRPHVPECMAYKMAFGFEGPHYQVRKRLEESELRRLSAAGMPISAIALELGVGASTVSRWLTRFGIDHPRQVGRPSR